MLGDSHAHVWPGGCFLFFRRNFRRATGKIKTPENGSAFVIAWLEQFGDERAQFFLHALEMNDETADHPAFRRVVFLDKPVKPQVGQGLGQEPEFLGKRDPRHDFVLLRRHRRPENGVLPATVMVAVIFAKAGYFIGMVENKVDREFDAPRGNEFIDPPPEIPGHFLYTQVIGVEHFMRIDHQSDAVDGIFRPYP